MDKKKEFSLFEVTPEIEHFARLCDQNNEIDKELYTKYDVKRGLRDLNGKGVLAGLTNVSDVCAKKLVDGVEVPCAGNLYYRGYNSLRISISALRRLRISCYLGSCRMRRSLRYSMIRWSSGAPCPRLLSGM